jgi:DNA-binding PadR family transcriptional regulator
MAFCGRGGFRTQGTRLSRVQLLLLALLSRGATHGYGILQDLRENLDGWELESGTVYPALRRLEETGFIIGKEVQQEERPDAVEYKLTPKGKQVLRHIFHGLGKEMRVQDNLWRFLSSITNGDSAERLLDWTKREHSPMGFIFLKRQCESDHCAPIHLEFLKQYRAYLQQELDWVKERLEELKITEVKKK